MQLLSQTNLNQKDLVEEFFRLSEGKWKSQRRYYSLKQENEPDEVTSILTIEFLDSSSLELIELADLHQLDNSIKLWSGTKVTWESTYTNKLRSSTTGSTIFGVRGDVLYRDRGFATSKPVTASFSFTNPQTMALRTEYNKSLFEEEIKLVGDNYRTRQTIISKKGEELMIGQYLEKRMN